MDYLPNELVKQTDSQKSITTTNMYSTDFTDSSSEKHNSSGMETYVLEWDSDGSESSHSKNVNVKEIPIKPIVFNTSKQCILANTIRNTLSSGIRQSIIAQEIYTQTSKTIIELAQNDGVPLKTMDCKSLETQTSFLTIKSTIQQNQFKQVEQSTSYKSGDLMTDEVTISTFDHSFGNSSTHLQQLAAVSKSESEVTCTTASPVASENNLSLVKPTSLDSSVIREDIQKDDLNTDHLSDDTDIDEDSLDGPQKHTSQKEINNELLYATPDDSITQFYNKLYDKVNSPNDNTEQSKKRVGQLSPLSEESVTKPESSNATVTSCNLAVVNNEDKDVLFTNNSGIKVKLFPYEQEAFKLPPINNTSGQITNNLDFLFTLNNNKYQQNTEPFSPPFPQNIFKEGHGLESWQIHAKDALASGESALISDKNANNVKPHPGGVQLPPINLDSFGLNGISQADHSMLDYLAPETSNISINKKIRELKLYQKNRSWSPTRYQSFRKCRSGSPSIAGFDSKTLEVAERSAEILCFEILKKLRTPHWYDVMETLIDIPNILETSWLVIPENRIADLLRQVTSHVESPRTQIARAACKTLSIILTNTKYTKKPDFYEAVTILLIKTGSFSRPVRHAANVALDKIVCAVHLSDVITVLCIHGASHKSALVRCAAARLLVVCCALGNGGRILLRSRPPSAATARRHALRSLSQLLDDKNTDTRKYAVRLYAMLRPLPSFEAYYLNDVDVELAMSQMKKYDQVLALDTREAR